MGRSRCAGPVGAMLSAHWSNSSGSCARKPLSSTQMASLKAFQELLKAQAAEATATAAAAAAASAAPAAAAGGKKRKREKKK